MKRFTYYWSSQLSLYGLGRLLGRRVRCKEFRSREHCWGFMRIYRGSE